MRREHSGSGTSNQLLVDPRVLNALPALERHLVKASMELHLRFVPSNLAITVVARIALSRGHLHPLRTRTVDGVHLQTRTLVSTAIPKIEFARVGQICPLPRCANLPSHVHTSACTSPVSTAVIHISRPYLSFRNFDMASRSSFAAATLDLHC
jgi:hypothetical protein